MQAMPKAMLKTTPLLVNLRMPFLELPICGGALARAGFGGIAATEIGRAHLGHAEAASLTSLPQSGHLMSATAYPLEMHTLCKLSRFMRGNSRMRNVST